jgi:integrase/recombinase XerD
MELFDQFIRERQYLKGSAPKTLAFYRQSWAAYRRHTGGEVTKANLSLFVMALKEKGMSTAGINSYTRGVNCYLAWLHENEYVKERLRIPQLKCEKKVKKTFTDAQLQAIIGYRPQRWYGKRLHALLCTLADTGIRVDEALTLTRDRVDFDNLLVTVKGKGNKQRVIPFSVELRKVLFKFLRTHKHDLVFPSKQGQKLWYDNVRREFNVLMTELNIQGFDGAFHAFRRAFAKSYLRHGGNVLYLQQALGHEDLQTTKGYVEIETEALRETHSRTSILARLR